MSDPLFIDDGYTRQSDVPAEAGIHPGAAVSYRPALPRERVAYAAKMQTRDPDQIDRYLCDLLVRHKVEVNGAALDAHRAGRLVPNLRERVIDLVLGYSPAQEAADVKNSTAG
jgi:hypothetical protein